MRRVLGGCLLLLVWSCAPPSGKPVLDTVGLEQVARALPGASVSSTAPLTISYPAGSLFAQRAVLPLPGGLEVLDPLAGLLAEPGQRWRILVRAASGRGADYDLQLAAMRVAFLQHYLAGRNVSQETLSWATASAEGAPLELTLEPGNQTSPDNSSGVKR